MSGESPEIVTDAEIRSALGRLGASPDQTGVFVDFDGVLAEIRPRPDEVVLRAGSQAALAALAEAYGLVAVVSGRSGDDLARRVPVPALTLVGSHGAELRRRGTWERRAAPDPALMVALVRELASDPGLRRHGVIVEPKAYAVALHARTAPDPQTAMVAAAQAASARASQSGLVVLRGRQVVELRPAFVDKGSAVTDLVEACALRAAVYVGDDLTDLDAVRALRLMQAEGGVRVLTLAVHSPEAPPALLAAADLVIDFGQVGAVLQYLQELAAGR